MEKIVNLAPHRLIVKHAWLILSTLMELAYLYVLLDIIMLMVHVCLVFFLVANAMVVLLTNVQLVSKDTISSTTGASKLVLMGISDILLALRVGLVQQHAEPVHLLRLATPASQAIPLTQLLSSVRLYQYALPHFQIANHA